MGKVIVLALILLLVWRAVTGRWPWQTGSRTKRAPDLSVAEARKMLDVPPGAGRLEIIAAHRRLVARIHPDRGGSDVDTQAANAARDTLLSQLEPRS